MFGSDNVNLAPRLDDASVKYIVDNIKDWSGDDKPHTIGIGTTSSIRDKYATSFSNKGWTVDWFIRD